MEETGDIAQMLDWDFQKISRYGKYFSLTPPPLMLMNLFVFCALYLISWLSVFKHWV